MTAQDYINLPFTKIVRRDEEGDFVARVVELPGCVADGVSESAALEALAEAQTLWIANAIRNGEPIPQPLPEEDSLPSGKWLQRVPRTLHQRLVLLAKAEGVSLNQYVTSVLAEAAGAKSAAESSYAPLMAHGEHHGLIDASFGSWAQVPNSLVAPGNWIIFDAKSHRGHHLIPEATVVFLNELADSIPDRWQIEGVDSLSSQELSDEHGPKVSKLSKRPATIRGRTDLVHSKG